MYNPLISCVCLTYNRLALFNDALQCFTKQTYENKELIIIDNGDDQYFSEIEKLVSGQDNIKHIHINNKTVGMYRNKGLEASSGEYICTWDDDDLHADDRLEHQMTMIKNHSVDAVMLMDFMELKIQDGITSTRDGRMTMGLDGTIMFRNPLGGICYANINRGEDTLFVSDLSSKLGYKILVVKNDPSLYTYRFHGGNITITEAVAV